MRRATNVLLSIIALALVVIAVNTMGPEAEAQPQLQIAPHVVGIDIWHQLPSSQTQRVYRAWSDGYVEYNTKPESSAYWSGWVAVPEECSTPSPACVK